jgi:mono/diheme cytochrome c family protein
MTTHTTHRATVAIAAGLALWTVSMGHAWSASQAARSVNDGVYTAAQAQRGGQVFEKNCTMCHDTARFTGDTFLKDWIGKPLHGLFEVVSTTMPEDNPGSLKPQEYGDVVAFFLELNKYPAGAEELKVTPDAMRAIAMAAPK